MAKLTKGMLKGIVKECLIEILSEGIADTPAALSEAIDSHETAHDPLIDMATRSRRPATQKLARPRSATLDRRVVPNKNFDHNVQQAVSTLTSDPILAEILTDTAKGSLQRVGAQDSALGSNHLLGETRGPAPTSGPTTGVDPTEAFDLIAPGASSKWAHLAFADPKNHLPGQ